MNSYEIAKSRSELFNDICSLCNEIALVQRGQKPSESEKTKVREFWVKLFGFNSLIQMTNEELRNFEELLDSRLKSAYSLKSLPGLTYG